MRRLSVLAALCLFAAVPTQAQSSASFIKSLKAPDHHLPGRALVQFVDRGDRDDDDEARLALKNLAARTGLRLQLVRQVVLGWMLVDVRRVGDSNVPDEADTLTLIARLADDDAVAHAQEERWARPLFAINDFHQAAMWPLDVARIRTAWDDERGSTGQRVAVVDTGILRSHEDLAGRIATGFDFISDFNNNNYANDGNGRDADFADAGDACNGSPNSFHGTHVAGTIAANANNGLGTAGVSHNAKLVVVRALGRCGGSSVDIMEGG